MEGLKLKIENSRLSITTLNNIVSGGINQFECLFEFSENWSELSKEAIFSNDHITKNMVIKNNKCLIPWEVLENTSSFRIVVQGIRDEQLVYSTNVVSRTVYTGNQNSYNTPSPSEWLQYITIVNEKVNEAEEQAQNSKTSAELSSANAQKTESDRASVAEMKTSVENTVIGFNSFAETKTNEFNNNAISKTNDFNTNANEKTKTFNDNYTTKKASIDKSYEDYNTNASEKVGEYNTNTINKVKDYNDNATTKTESFNTNYTEKKKVIDDEVIEFSSNVETKTNEFNSNVSAKTNDFNTNATTKTNTFNTNVTDKTKLFNDNYTIKKASIDKSYEDYNVNANTKTEEYNTNSINKVEEYNSNAESKVNEFNENVDQIEKDIEVLEADKQTVTDNLGEYVDSVKAQPKEVLVNGATNVIVEGEISPDNPARFDSVGDSYNLFDKENMNVLNTPIDQNGLGSNVPNAYKTIWIKCKPNTDYTVQKGFVDTVKNRFSIGTTENTPNYSMSTMDFTTDILNKSEYLSVKTSSNANYLCAYVWINGANTSFEDLVNTLQIVEGTEAKPYRPYGKSLVEVETRGKNLLDLNGSHFTFNTSDIVIDENSITMTGAQVSSYRFDVDYELNKKYYVSLNVQMLKNYTGISNFSSVGFRKNSTWIAQKQLEETGQLQNIEFEVTFTEKGYQLWLYVNSTQENKQIRIKYSDIMISTESSSYEPYIEPSKVTIETEPLRSVPNLKGEGFIRDEGMLVGNKFIRKEKIKRFLIDENSNLKTVSAFPTTYGLSLGGLSLYGISDKYATIETGSQLGVDIGMYSYTSESLLFSNPNYATLEEFKASLIGNPIEALVVLQDYEVITETEIENTLLLQQGKNIVELIDPVETTGEVTYIRSSNAPAVNGKHMGNIGYTVVNNPDGTNDLYMWTSEEERLAVPTDHSQALQTLNVGPAGTFAAQEEQMKLLNLM